MLFLIYALLSFLPTIIEGRRANAIVCDKQAAIDSAMRLSTDFVDYFNSGDLGMIFKRLMRPGATLTGSTAAPDCRQMTTNLRTTLIEQYQTGLRIEGINKSTFFSAKDSAVIVNVAHLTGQMGNNPALVDVKLYLAAEDDCSYKIQSMTQTPYGCLKASM